MIRFFMLSLAIWGLLIDSGLGLEQPTFEVQTTPSNAVGVRGSTMPAEAGLPDKPDIPRDQGRKQYEVMDKSLGDLFDSDMSGSSYEAYSLAPEPPPAPKPARKSLSTPKITLLGRTNYIGYYWKKSLFDLWLAVRDHNPKERRWRSVEIVRMKKHKEVRIKVNLGRYFSGADLAANLKLREDDVVVVK